MKRLFGKNGGLSESMKSSDFGTSGRQSVTPEEVPLRRIESAPTQPEIAPNPEVNIDALLLDSRFGRHIGTNSGFEPMTMSKMEKGFEEVYQQMITKGEILEISPTALKESSIKETSQQNGTSGNSVGRNSERFSIQENRSDAMFESCFYTSAPKISLAESTVPDTNVSNPTDNSTTEPPKEAEPEPAPVIDAKFLTSMMHTRFRVFNSLVNDREYHLDPEPDTPKGITVRDVFEKFGDTEIQEIKKVIKAQLTKPSSPIQHRVFVSNLQDHQLVAEAKASTRLSTIAGDNSISPESKKRYISENPQLFLLETAVLDELNELITPERFNSVRCVALSAAPHRTFLVGLHTGELLECTLTPKKTVQKHKVGDNVSAVALSPAGTYFAAGALNSEVLVKKVDSMGKKVISSLDGNQIWMITHTLCE